MAETEGGIGDTLRTILKDVEELVRSELRLARAELRSEATGMIKAAALAAFALLLGGLAVAFLLLAMFFGLRGALSAWLSALMVAALAAILAGALVQMARSVVPPPGWPRTVSTIKENIEWAKQQPRQQPR